MFARPGLCGLGIGRLGLVAASRSLFDPLSLFAAGEQGAWYDPSDLSTLFQDAAGTTPVTAAGQPVGRMLDKSGRGNHATQSTANSRPILQQEAGGQWYLACDGSDDWMSTSSINFTGTSAVTTFAGLRKLSDAAAGIFFELSASAITNQGSFSLRTPHTAAANYGFISTGSIQTAAVTGNSYAAPISSVIACSGGIAGDTAILRVNGAQVAISTGDQGTGNYGDHKLFLFRRAGTSLPFNGHFYGLILRGAASTADQTTNAERWMAAKTGVTF